MESRIRLLQSITRLAWSVAPARRAKIGAALLAGAGQMGLVVAGPLLGARIIDSLSAQSWATFRLFVLLAAVVAVVQVWVTFVQQRLYVSIEEETADNLRRRVVRGVLGQDVNFFRDHWTGDVISRAINDTAPLKSFLTSVLLQVIIDAIALVVVIVVLVRANLGLTLLTVAITALSVIHTQWVQKKLEEVNRLVSVKIARVMASLQSWLSRPLLVKQLFLEARAAEQFGRNSTDLAEETVRLGGLVARVAAVNAALIGAPSLVVFGYGGHLVLQGRMSIGGLFAFMAFAAYFSLPFQRFIALLAQLPTFYAVYGRIRDLLLPASASLQVDATGPSERDDDVTEIRLRDVVFPASPQQGAADFELSVPTFVARRGEIVGIAGPNGSGKSSLLGLLSGLHRPLSVEVCRDGSACPDRGTRDLFAVLPQEGGLFDGTFLENATLFHPDPDVERVSMLAEALGVSHLAGASDSIGNEAVGPGRTLTLSGGELQKLSLIRMLYRDAPVWILDEPEGSLDNQAIAVLVGILREATKKIIILSSHSPSILSCCHRTYSLKSSVGSERRFRCVEDQRADPKVPSRCEASNAQVMRKEEDAGKS